MKRFVLLALLLGLSTQTWGKPLIVTSIRPLTMIVNAIAGDAIEVHQLLPNAEEPHHYAMRISDQLKLNQADLVVWVGPELESFLVRATANLNPEKVITVTFMPGIQMATQTTTNDPHVWLNPNNGIIIATEVGNWIAAHFPALRETMLTNQQQFREEIRATSANISERLLPVKNSKILVDHDAYGHFFSFFDVQQVGALKTRSGLPAGADSLQALLKEKELDCIIADPRSRHSRIEKVAHTIAPHTEILTVMIDPLGADISDSDNTYLEFLNSMTSSLERCVTKASQQVPNRD